MNKPPYIVVLLILPFLLMACDSSDKTTKKNVNSTITEANNSTSAAVQTAKTKSEKWYSFAQTLRGKTIYNTNCAVCHGDKGQGDPNWQQRQSDGSFPPPALNGSAHTWHHPKSSLLQTISEGGIAKGGKMPAFKDVLSELDRENVLAFIQSLWPEEAYQAWDKRGK